MFMRTIVPSRSIWKVYLALSTAGIHICQANSPIIMRSSIIGVPVIWSTVISLTHDHPTHSSRGVLAIARPPWYTMHMWILHSLPGTAAQIHAHIEPITSTLFQEISSILVGRLETFHYVLLCVNGWHEQTMSRGDRITVAENLDRAKV